MPSNNPSNEKHRVLTVVERTESRVPHSIEVYYLDVGEVFEGFGGSRSALVAEKTASMVVCEWSGGGRTDYEYNINGQKAVQAWARVAHCIAQGYLVENGPGAKP